MHIACACTAHARTPGTRNHSTWCIATCDIATWGWCERRSLPFLFYIAPQTHARTHARTQTRAHARTHEHEHEHRHSTAARAHQPASTHTRAWQVPAGPSDSPKAPGGPSAVADMPPGVSKKKFRSGPKRARFFAYWVLYWGSRGLPLPAAAFEGGRGWGIRAFRKNKGANR